MIKLKGIYDDAIIYASDVEQEALDQIQSIIDNPVSQGANTRIMPDVHAGAGICIGYTAKLTDRVVPYFIGVDIGCGMRVAYLDVETDSIDFDRLDKVIRRNVPSGFSIRKYPSKLVNQIDLSNLKCFSHLKNINKFYRAVGTLGGGNHFIEVNVDENGQVYLVVHTGSRNLGKQVADYYQNLAYEQRMKEGAIDKDKIILHYRQMGRHAEIEDVLKNLPPVIIDKNTAYLEEQSRDDYLHDMGICQRYSTLNRRAIINSIAVGMRWKINKEIETLHNYIDLEYGYIRKGAVSAKLDETLIIPMNMSYGSVLCRGLGNPEWNYSAPHGSGRKMSRKNARKNINMESYEDSMKDVFSTCVSKETLDEAPMAYKDPKVIIEDMKNTVEVLHHLRPIYNYKDN